VICVCIALKCCNSKYSNTACEIDRLAYRSAFPYANELFDQSYRDHMRSELEACTDPRQRWTVTKRLLHTDNGPAKQPSVINIIELCEQFAKYFVSKIEQLCLNIVCKLSDTKSISLCLLNLYVLANYVTPYHQSLLVRSFLTYTCCSTTGHHTT